jgi:hypothetical protein
MCAPTSFKAGWCLVLRFGRTTRMVLASSRDVYAIDDDLAVRTHSNGLNGSTKPCR